MKISVTCTECLHQDKVIEVRDLEMNNDGVFNFTCQYGHENVVILQKEKFEALFDIGVSALLNGYRTEAIASFATSLERFYEWFTYVISIKNEINIEVINNSWKPLSNSSERQLGAFLIYHLAEFKESAPKIDTNKVSLRNKVLHKGYIPEYEEVHDYGEYVLKYIRTILDKMADNYSEYYYVNIMNQISKLTEKYSGVQSSTTSIPTVIGLNTDSKINNMDEALNHIKSQEDLQESMRNISLSRYKDFGKFM